MALHYCQQLHEICLYPRTSNELKAITFALKCIMGSGLLFIYFFILPLLSLTTAAIPQSEVKVEV